MVNIKKYFPNIYDGVLEIDTLIESENSLFNKLEEQFNKVILNQFIITCDSDTLNKYENLFNIVNDSSKDINFRRERVLNRLAMNSAFTLRFLESKLDELIGKGKYKVDIDYDKYSLYLESVSLNQDWFTETFITINKIKPANIILVNKPKIDGKIVSNEEVSYGVREYNYKLGTKWQLGEKPFKSLNEKGVIKMPTGKSITEDLLDTLRVTTLNKIHHVRINGTFTKDVFIKKEINDRNLIIEYEVLKSELQGSNISKVELMDVNNNVLTEINVYIQVIEDLEIKHVLKVEEGVVNNAI